MFHCLKTSSIKVVVQHQSCSAINYLSNRYNILAGDDPIPVKLAFYHWVCQIASHAVCCSVGVSRPSCCLMSLSRKTFCVGHHSGTKHMGITVLVLASCEQGVSLVLGYRFVQNYTPWRWPVHISFVAVNITLDVLCYISNTYCNVFEFLPVRKPCGWGRYCF